MVVNGNDMILDGSKTLGTYLAEEGYNLTRIAVELNGKIVPKTEYERTLLDNRSVIEIVCFVGGG